MDPADAMKNAQQLDNSSAPDAADSACQEVARLLQPKRATQTTGEILARFDSLPRKTGSRMQTKGAFLGTGASAMSLRDAPPQAGEIAVAV